MFNTKTITYLPASVPEKTGFDLILDAIRYYIHTPYGRDRLQRLKPLSEPDDVRMLARQTSEMQELFQGDETLPLQTLDEIDIWLERAAAEGSTLTTPALHAIRQHVRLARLLHTFIEKHREEAPELWRVAADLQPVSELEKALNRALTDKGELRDDASNELRTIRSKLTGRKQALRQIIQKLFRQSVEAGRASDEGPTLRNGRMVIPILAEHKRKVEGFVHDVSASGQTVYLEPVEALQINNDIRQLEAEEKREVERILKFLTTLVRHHRPQIRNNAPLIGELDLIHARTRLGQSWEGALPEPSEQGTWHIIGAMNPVLMLKNRRLKQSDREAVVPLDLEIEETERGIIISGPNAGGKSVALKTTALLAMMYQSGIPLPTEPHSELPIVSGVFLDLGDDQSIESDLSTFSSRLKWMGDVLEAVNERSLVLIDEAGTGTDPDEGSALFQAFMEKLLEQGAHLLASTHHGALKVFANDHPLLANGAMEFDQQTLTPTYRFRKGTPGSSYAFEIARRMKLPETLLNRSLTLLGEQRDRLAELLLDLEQRLREADDRERHFRKLSDEAAEAERAFRSRDQELASKRDEIIQKALSEADQIMSGANRRIEQAVEKITTAGEQRETVRRTRRKVDEHKKEIREQLSEIEKRQRRKQPGEQQAARPGIGDAVTISGGDTTGELIERNGNQAVVLANGLKIRTRYDNLVKSSGKRSSASNKTDRWLNTSSKGSWSGGPVKPSLDIRGKRGDEAIRELMLYLDRAVAAGLQEVQVIHGKGEGILRKLVGEYLEKRREVTHFEDAPWESGGPGCTVVQLN